MPIPADLIEHHSRSDRSRNRSAEQFDFRWRSSFLKHRGTSLALESVAPDLPRRQRFQSHDSYDIAYDHFLALLFAALALVPAGAHLAELANKMKLGATEYQTVQQIYRGWALFGVVVIGALASTLGLTINLRHHQRAFTPALIAFLCIMGTQIVFWSLTFPVNQTTVNWTCCHRTGPSFRLQWEYSHAASAGLNFVALIALIVSVLRHASAR